MSVAFLTGFLALGFSEEGVTISPSFAGSNSKSNSSLAFFEGEFYDDGFF